MISGFMQPPASTGGLYYLSLSTSVSLVATDYLEIKVYGDDIAATAMVLVEQKRSGVNGIIEKKGINDIIIDPGFGFGKTIDQNYELLNQLQDLRLLKKPILVGFSRKSMIYNKLNCTPQQTLNGTTILNTLAIQKEASILRVHDVKEAKDIITLLNY